MRTPHDPMWEAPRRNLDELAVRRAYFGHQDERDAPAYCTCGKLSRECPVAPRKWADGWGQHWPGDGCEDGS